MSYTYCKTKTLPDVYNVVMKIPRFYQDSDWQLGETILLSKENHRHAVQVLRLKKNESLILFNGKGGEFKATIVETNKRKTEVLISDYERINRESPINTTLAMAIIKQDRMDFAIQKAVELGVNQIQPLNTERSVIKLKAQRLEKKLQHWQGVIIAACEQSGRTNIPEIALPVSLNSFIGKHMTDHLSIVMSPESSTKLADIKLQKKPQGVTLYVGPEGGFTHEEEREMKANSIQSINFGKRILRAETAVVAGLTACQQQWGDL